jgi:hypothetical protein
MSASTGPKDSPENTHFSEAELFAVVQEAKRRQVLTLQASPQLNMKPQFSLFKTLVLTSQYLYQGTRNGPCAWS